MGYAQFVGRVGALAVALGVTNVVGHPLVAWAEEPSSESSTTGGTESALSTGTPDKPAETQSADPTTAPSHEPADTEEASPETKDDETSAEETEAESLDPTTTSAPEPEETQAPQPDPTTVEVPETKDAHPSEAAQTPDTAEDNTDTPEPDDQSRFVVHALTVSGIDEQSLDAPLPMALAIPVSADLATSSAAPTAAVTITKVDPVTVEETHPFRSLVLGVLGIFGFDPTPGATNDAFLASLWAAYRGYERRFENESPTVSGATVLSTSQTADGYTAVTISVGFTDPDGDTLHFTTTNGHAGTLTANGDGTYTYLTNTPGTDTVTITANDDDGTGHLHGLLGWLFKPDAGHTRTVTLTLNVTAPTNGAPVAGDDTATTDEDTPVTIHVLTNDTDPDNDPLSVATFTQGAHGTVTLNTDGTFSYTPNENYNGTDEFTYTATDGILASLASHVTVTINPVNDAPIAHDATVHNVSENSTTSATLANLVTDADGDPLTLEIVDQPELGSVTFVTATGFFYYAPTEVGTATSTTFTYRAFDGTDYSNTATVTIEFTNTNDAPTANDDDLNTDEDTPLVITPTTLLDNDTDPENNTLTITTVSNPGHGTLQTNTDGTYTYTPAANYNGEDTFTYTVTDGTLDTQATVHITINPVNDAPVAHDATVHNVSENSTTSATLANLVTDADGDPLTLEVVDQPELGSVTFVTATGFFYYAPTEVGTATSTTFTYRAFDGTDYSNTATVTIEFTNTNDAPTANDDTATTDEDTPVVIDVLANDTDPETDALSVGWFSHGAHGTVTRNADGTLTYTPDENYSGTDEFSYTAADGALDAEATVHITINPTNDAPAIDRVVSTPETGNTWTVTVIANDPDGDALTTVIATDPDHVDVTGSGDSYAVTVVDTDWAAAHPGTQISITITTTDGDNSVETTSVIGTVNNAVAVVGNYGQTEIPALPAGVIYTQAATGLLHTVLLRSDGTVVGIGNDTYGQTDIPELPSGLTYLSVAAGDYHTILVRSDGTAVAFGENSYGQTDVPEPPTGLIYTQAAGGGGFTVLLRSDGTAIAFGDNTFGQTDIPPLPTAVTYRQVSAGDTYTVLLRSDGVAVATGYGFYGQAEMPLPPAGLTYTQVSTGNNQTVLLRSDGQAVAVGFGFDGQSVLTPPPAGMVYTQVTAGEWYAVLIRSDGQAITVDFNDYGHNEIPALPDGAVYTQSVGRWHMVLLTAVGNGPHAVADTATTDEGNPVTLTDAQLLVNDTDPQNDPLVIIGVSQGLHGTTSMSGGVITYTPAAGYHGDDTFTYTVTDGNLDALGSVTVTVNPVNTAPVITGSASPSDPDEDGRVTGSFTVTDLDGDNPAVSVGFEQPQRGRVEFAVAPGDQPGVFAVSYVYTPTQAARLRAALPGASSQDLTDSFTISLDDGQGATASTDAITVPVTPATVALTTVTDAATWTRYTSHERVDISPDGATAYVTDGIYVAVVDLATGHVTGRIQPVGDYYYGGQFIATYGVGAEDVLVNAATGTLYTRGASCSCGHGMAAVSAADGSSTWIAANNTFDDITLSPDGQFVFGADPYSRRLVVVRTSDNTVVSDVALDGFVPHAVAAVADGRVFLAGANSAGVGIAVLSGPDHTVSSVIPLPGIVYPVDLMANADGSRLYTIDQSYSPDVGTVATIVMVDTESATVTTVATNYSLGAWQGIALSPDGSLLYIPDPVAGMLHVLDSSTGEQLAQIGASNARDVAVSQDGHTVVVSGNDPAAVTVISIGAPPPVGI